LTQIYELLNLFNLNEVEACKGFDPEGIFSSHLSSVGYNNIFTRITENMEEVDDNDPNTNKAVFRKDEQICDDDLVTQVSSNTQVKNIESKREHQ
jgi:hypothetical protein